MYRLLLNTIFLVFNLQKRKPSQFLSQSLQKVLKLKVFLQLQKKKRTERESSSSFLKNNTNSFKK